MTRKSQSATARVITIAGLIAAPVGILILILSGVDFPPIPPGIAIPLVGAALVVFLRQ